MEANIMELHRRHRAMADRGFLPRNAGHCLAPALSSATMPLLISPYFIAHD
jgi:hypothetical protein